MLKKLSAIRHPIGTANTIASVSTIGNESSAHFALAETPRIMNLHIHGDVRRPADGAESVLVVGDTDIDQADGASELDDSCYRDDLGASSHTQIIDPHVDGRDAMQQL